LDQLSFDGDPAMSRRFVRPILAFWLLSLLLASDLTAQGWRRSGLWYEAGTGPASIRVACSTCTDVTRSSGTGAFMRLGGTLSRKIFLGIEAFSLINETFGFEADDESLLSENSTLAVIVLWYPWRHRFFVKSGVGLASGEFIVDATSDEPILSDGLGVGMTFGVGFDVPVWRSLALTTNAGVAVTAIGDVVLPTTTVDDVIATMYNLSIGITIR
jgi:hypothetical protein